MLSDLLKKNLMVVICGTAVAKCSAERGSYYVGVGNKFWSVLYKVRLTPIQLKTENYQVLLKYGIGLTDLVKKKAGTDDKLSSDDFDVKEFKRKIQDFCPKIVCFNGKKAAKVVLCKKVEYGYQKELIGISRLFVAPSTSGVAKRWWDQKWWQELSDFIKK
jgi:TDG/mug DNA glycosylase family protein